MASLYHNSSPPASVMRLVASIEDSRFMRPSRFPARDEWTAREEDARAIGVAVVLDRRQDRFKGGRGEGAPDSLCDFVHGDAIDKKLTLRRTSAPIPKFVSHRGASIANFEIEPTTHHRGAS